MSATNLKKPRPIQRSVSLCLGLFFLTMGLIGVVVPGWPTTVFTIIALYFFKKSSARLENWLLNHKILGPTLRDWDENKWISSRAKWISCSCILVFSTFACLTINKPDPIRTWGIRGLILAGALAGISYILTRRTKPNTMLAVVSMAEQVETEIVA
jgi:uncharacterized membrane protein YbaN (DUF454 family)